MPNHTVHFMPSGKSIEVPSGASLQDAVERVGLPLSSSCNGEFLCGFCALEVLQGLENLGEAGTEETKVLQAMGAGCEERLACQAKVTGPVTVRASYW